MIKRWVIDLGEERANEDHNVKYWKYLYVGDCDGDVRLRFNTPRGADLNPEEFDKIVGLEDVHTLFISNAAQSGKVLVLYYEIRGETVYERIRKFL